MSSYAENLDYLLRVYSGSDGNATKALYDTLANRGAAGLVALNLFRAQKNSARAKVYRGGNSQGSYRGQAYDRKQWSMAKACEILSEHAASLGMRWGWGRDVKTAGFEWVLYVELPTGQVSFHNAARGAGPDYIGQWDGVRNASTGRICQWIAGLLSNQAVAA